MTLVAVTAGVGGRFGVCAGGGISGVTVKNPHPFAHTCQSTPAALESLATAAFKLTVAPCCNWEGGAGTKLTARAVAAPIVTGDEGAFTLGNETDVAMIVTSPDGGTGGAVYVAALPLALW